MKTLVLYYSNNGSNRYLAQKIARAIEGDIEPLRPRMNAFLILLLFSALKKSMGIAKIKHDPGEYDRVILCGPIWMGLLISPLRDMLNAYGPRIKKFWFATCCGSTDAGKDQKFGYGTVFPKIRELIGDRCVHCEAFPIALVLPENTPKDSNLIMKTRLSDDTFDGPIRERVDIFIKNIKEERI